MSKRQYLGTSVEIWIQHPYSSSNRDATKAELAASKKLFEKIEAARKVAEDAAAALEKLKNSCKHVVFYDTIGFMGDPRTCAACSVDLGII